jgi:hypothetical protein
MRSLLPVIAVIAACHPSATVENTMPIANMQSYRSVGLRVHSTAFAAQGQAMQLESSVVAKLQGRCSFDRVLSGQTAGADIMLDLNVVNAGRGSSGILSNGSTARLDTLLVISDGKDGELLGTARIHGESSGMIINNGSPELEAIDVVAKTVADVFWKSGCSGPRVAKAEPPTPPSTPDPTTTNTGSGSTEPAIDESHRAEAEKLNDDGKQKVFVADVQGALVAFQNAEALIPDARYEYNICSTLGLLEKWDAAIATCNKALDRHPKASLEAKLKQKIDLLQHHQ